MTAVAARVAAPALPAALTPQLKVELSRAFMGAPPGTRTPNPQIKSLLLCQLS
jgi:hypothetical protein